MLPIPVSYTHLTPGEDGRLQGYFDMLHTETFQILVAGKLIVRVRIAESLLLRGGQSVTDEDVMEKIGLPCFIKPSLGAVSYTHLWCNF